MAMAHSEYLSAFAEAGVSGFLPLLLMFVAPVVRWCARSRRAADRRQPTRRW